MAVSKVQRLFILPTGAVLALGLAGCSGTTYGTGISPEQQTLTDVMGIASLGSNEAPPIDYRPRGGIVAPPSATLPVPGSAPVSTAGVDDPNWPKDPDELNRQRKIAKANAPVNQQSPNFVLPKGQTSYSVASANTSTEQTRAEGKKAWDALHSGKSGSVDANGNPTRKYLTDPPVAYRAPDPNEPMKEPPKKKLKWDMSKLWPF